MNSNIQIPGISSNVYLDNYIVKHTKFRRTEPKASFNYYLLLLYYRIGSSINLITKNIPKSEADIIITSFSNLMSKHFGDIFNINNIYLIEQFYQKCDETLFKNIASHISWDHLIVLMEFIEPSDWISYLRIAIEHHFTPSELKKQIKSNTLKSQLATKLKFPESPFLDIIHKAENYPKLPVEDFFSKENKKRYSKIFFEPISINVNFTANSANAVKILFQNATININYLQRLTSPFSNLRFSLSLFDIGDAILNYPDRSNKNAEKLLIEAAIALKNEVSMFFSINKVRQMVAAATHFQDMDERKDLAANLRWEHIVELIGIKDKVLRNYFGKLAIDYNLNGKALKKEIQISMPYFLKNNDATQKNVKFKTIGRIFLDGEVYGNILTNNILKNKDFMLFMK